MDDSLRGVLIAVTIAGLFMTAILNFIIIFPQEQGVIFNTSADANTYLVISQYNDSGTSTSLTLLNNQSEDAFDQWDITQGFMGSNQLAHSQGKLKNYQGNLFTNLKILATQLFGANSPILYAIGVIALLCSSYILYLIIKWIRTGS